jgi:hypothetical protein
MSDSPYEAGGTTLRWDVEQAKIELGIANGESGESGDSGQEAALQRVLDYVIAAVEKLLQRGILWRLEVLTLYDRPRPQAKILLYRYPIIDVLAIDGEEPPDGIQINEAPGWVRLPSVSSGPTLEIVYEGGYDEFPPDLERVLWEAVRYIWARSNEETGGPAASSVAAGSIKALTVFDAFRIEYATDGGGSVASDMERVWGWLSPWASTLELYRSDAGTWVS